MSDFEMFFKMGLEHILTLSALDHILFIITLCAVYSFMEWRKVIVLVTAFTLGHSITLALSGLEYVSVSGELVEFLIPITIFLTALYNVFLHDVFDKKKGMLPNYWIAAFFGLIHGLAFSNFFKEMMMGMSGVVKPLFSFNLGIEVGQLIIVSIILGLNIGYSRLGLNVRFWNFMLSVVGGFVALKMIAENII